MKSYKIKNTALNLLFRSSKVDIRKILQVNCGCSQNSYKPPYRIFLNNVSNSHDFFGQKLTPPHVILVWLVEGGAENATGVELRAQSLL